ncbi:hypothetical protein AHAS_Ahas17G0137500 [Arachis hypogaea]
MPIMQKTIDYLLFLLDQPYVERSNYTSLQCMNYMNDDHRKKGILVPTKKEFRGYYTLLKLDKHPGYKVEPAKLFLNLVKMTLETRQTPKILLACDVARFVILNEN